MSGTKVGGIKARKANLARDPEHYRRIGKKGGLAKGSTTGGFAQSSEYARECGRRGGAASKRKRSTEPPKQLTEEELEARREKARIKSRKHYQIVRQVMAEYRERNKG